MNSSAHLWLAASSPGYCEKTDNRGDCTSGDKGKTSVKKGTLEPEWDETIELSIYDKDILDADEASDRRCRASLFIELWDHDTLLDGGMNDSLGHCEARLEGLSLTLTLILTLILTLSPLP